jgi:ubiquitin-activating enzyme E1
LDCYDRQYLNQLNKACRENNVGFIYAGNLGLYGFAFVDFGEKHKVLDLTG